MLTEEIVRQDGQNFQLWGFWERKLLTVAEGVSVSGIALVLIVLRLVHVEAVVWFVVVAFSDIVYKIADPREG